MPARLVRLTREEVILVLDTYFRLVGASIAPDAPEVVRLRHLLRSLAIHPGEVRSGPSFRSAEGLAGRVRVFQRLARGQSNGIPNTYREVWDEFREAREALEGEVERIKRIYSDQDLVRDRVYSWEELAEIYGFRPQYFSAAGGMISVPAHECVLLITHPTGGRAFDYKDYWDNGDLIYTGKGQIGNQEYTGANRYVLENSRQLLLFEATDEARKLKFLGEVFQYEFWEEDAPDVNGDLRTQIRFALRFKDPAYEIPATEAIASSKYFGFGESDAHKHLKEWVASHPESIGLEKDSQADIEHQFLSPDRADIVFETPDNAWVAVEIELKGERNCRIGAWQAIKYRSLLALEHSLPLDSPRVSAVLVAHEIHERVRELCARYEVECYEFDLE